MLLNLEEYLNKNLSHAEEEIELIPLIRQSRIEEQCIFKRQFKRQVKRFAKAKKGYCNSMIKKWAKTVIKYQFEFLDRAQIWEHWSQVALIKAKSKAKYRACKDMCEEMHKKKEPPPHLLIDQIYEENYK